jgi:hypothetical protein
MGFISNENTGIKLIAKLTPYGRQQILSNSNTNVIKYFSLGDSDANYLTPLTLGNGEIPTMGGDFGGIKSMDDDYVVKNKILVDSLGNTKKLVETTSNTINTVKERLGQKTIGSDKVQQFLVNRDDFNSNNMVNVLYSCGLPITINDKTLFNSVTNANGGFSDTALSTLNNNTNLIIGIDNVEYGELIDGKSIKLDLETLNDTYAIYGTFQQNQTPLETQDAKLKEITTKSKLINNNIVFLFADKIKKPNGDATKSWSTGFAKTKPYSVNNKELFNLTDNSNVGIQKDECVGVAYLDKGIIVITHPTLANNYDVNDASASNIQVTFNSVVTKISQDVTCIIGRGEFISSTNKTYNNDTIRVSEVGIYDGNNKLIALAKPNEHLEIGGTEFMAIGVKISV